MTTVVSIAIHLLESIFILGLAGSAIVLVLTAVEDVETLMGSDKLNQD